MSYATYITAALVCGSRAQNTSDRSFILFTREAGMLWASAKSVREERSKQRFSLQEFSVIRLTLVRGKAGWRIAGAEPILNVYSIKRTREARALARNVVKLLRRLLHGERAEPALFDEVVGALIDDVDGEEAAREEVLTIRMLHLLGYIAPIPEIEALLAAPSIRAAVPLLHEKNDAARRALIEHAFRESHL